MLKASALYIVIIVALVIGVLCSALIVSAYFYKEQYLKSFRYTQLKNNVGSGINLLIASEDDEYRQESIIGLFNNDVDSVAVKKLEWGVFDIGISKAFIQQDTLYSVFSLANSIDSSKWAALYLIDEDRPISVSGKTMIKRDVYIPKAGVKKAYVDGKSYEGDDRIIIGKSRNSDKKLPELNNTLLNKLQQQFDQKLKPDSSILAYDFLKNSFLKNTRIGSFGKKVRTINQYLEGNIILYSDTTLIIDKMARLNNVVIFARSIIVKDGFVGNCQLFATDSISIGRDCTFNYPSCLGVLQFNSSIAKTARKINIQENSKLSGIVFTYDKTGSTTLQPLIDLGKNVSINGNIFSQGFVGLKDGVVINGSVFTNRFLYQSSFTRFENYIINTTINSTALSKYYLSSSLLPIANQKKKVLKWLEAN